MLFLSFLEDTQANERSINQIIDAYKQKFQQESVLVVVDETLSIAFDVNNNIAPTGLTPSTFDLSNMFEQNKQPYFTIAP
jgi:phosphopantetheine adenylyltransferase